jgi:tetratricopeptide (TPR) repeat protein
VRDERAGFLEGLRLMLSGDPIAAIDHFEEVARRYPRNRDVLYGLAEAQFHGGRPAAAMLSFRRVYDLAPSFGLGLLHPFTYYSAHADEEGMSWALQRLERLPKDSSNQHWIWRVQIARRQYDEALRSIERIAAAPGPNKASPNAIAHELAQIHLVNGRMEMASTLLTPPRTDNTQLPYAIALWSIADAEGDRAGSSKAHLHVSYSRASGERRAGVE